MSDCTELNPAARFTPLHLPRDVPYQTAVIVERPGPLPQ